MDAKSQILVLQSFHESSVTGWQGRCLASVRQWCEQQGYTYRHCHDDLFDRLPNWYWEKVASRKPIAADLARLLWIREALAQGEFDLVAWLDADTLILDPQSLRLCAETTCVFGQEYWLEAKSGKNRIRKNVHNAYCAFRPDCPVLPFLIEVIQRMVRRVDARFLAPQFVGPKLLTHLHNTVDFELDARFGALSPAIVSTLGQGEGHLFREMRAAMSVPLMAANLCASLHDDQGSISSQILTASIDRLLASRC